MSGAFIAWITHKLLVNLNLFFAAKDGPATFELLPSPAIWWFLPGAAALTLGWELTLLLWSIFGDRLKIAQYIQWSNVKAGFDSTKALRWLSLLVTLPVGVLTALAVPMHTTLLEGSMCIREYAAPSSLRYPYKDARRLAAVASLRDRDGKSQPRAEILVKFSDGRVWSSAANRDFEKHVDADLLKFLQMKTGLHVEHAEAEADLSPSF